MTGGFSRGPRKGRDSPSDGAIVVGAGTGVGAGLKFNVRSVAGDRIAEMLRTEICALIAQMSLGTGALALIGGTVAVVGLRR